MPSGGEIFMKTGRLNEKEMSMTQISFQDSGPGIDDENPHNTSSCPFFSPRKAPSETLVSASQSASSAVSPREDSSADSHCELRFTLQVSCLTHTPATSRRGLRLARLPDSGFDPDPARQRYAGRAAQRGKYAGVPGLRRLPRSAPAR